MYSKFLSKRNHLKTSGKHFWIHSSIHSGIRILFLFHQPDQLSAETYVALLSAFPELHVRYLLLLSSVEGFSSLSSHKLSIRAPLTVQNLIYTQLKTGSKLRLEREEDSSTERKTFNCEFEANARSFHEHITLNRSKRKITLVGSQARNSE